MTASISPTQGAAAPFLEPTPVGAVWRPSEEGDTAGAPIRCNGCAWGLACERRDACTNRLPGAEFAAATRGGLPTLELARQGYTLFACTPGRFEHFAPVPGWDLV